MDFFSSILDQLSLLKHLTALLIGMPRLFAVGLVAPFMGTGVIEGQVWLILILGMYLPIHPMIFAELTPDMTITMPITAHFVFHTAFIFFKEVVIGLALGFLAALPFWAIQSAGFFIDNQRGASQAEDTDILTGKSISPTGGVLFECLIYLLYSSGAFLVFLGLVYASYEVWPVTHLLPFPTNFSIPLFFAERIAWLMTFMMLMSAPIAVACLLVDVSLGLINRFAPQLNAYVLAMPIKSGLASFLLYFYIAYILNQSPKIFQNIDAAILKFKSLMPT
ncbi:MAG: type III secretion system export apparatus subunit SctT [Desulfovibrionaceae bacterium]|nr:type III secretion system export apparatus subunit SctT [Desulfovibrionaceae bacterium]